MYTHYYHARHGLELSLHAETTTWNVKDNVAQGGDFFLNYKGDKIYRVGAVPLTSEGVDAIIRAARCDLLVPVPGQPLPVVTDKRLQVSTF
jgi:hypothetical protein